MPLTPAGKLDRQALPEPEFRSAAQNYRAPSGPVERIIADAAASVLGVERVGVDDSFFALGGDSIVAISLVSRAKSRRSCLHSSRRVRTQDGGAIGRNRTPGR